MPALNFKAQFAPLVESGKKRRTIRAFRKDKRDPKKNDPLYFYTGLRTKQSRPLIVSGIKPFLGCKPKNTFGYPCKAVTPIRITQDWASVFMAGKWANVAHLDTFAQLDGLADWNEMRDWFDKTHGLPFDGLLIEW